MIIIGTNIINKMSLSHKQDLEADAKKLFKIISGWGLSEYKEKEIEDNQQSKFFLGDLPLKDMLGDISVWDSFSQLVNKIFDYYQKDVGSSDELQFWVTSLQKPLPINIFFSVKNMAEISEKMQSLRDTLLISKVFDVVTGIEGKILIVGYDNEGNAWRINYL